MTAKNVEQRYSWKPIDILGKSFELSAGVRLFRLALVGKTASGSLATNLDLTGLVKTADKAKGDSGQPEAVSELAVLLDVLELVGTGSVNLEAEAIERRRKKEERSDRSGQSLLLPREQSDM